MPKPPETDDDDPHSQRWWQFGGGYHRPDGPAVIAIVDRGKCSQYWHRDGVYKGHLHGAREDEYVSHEGYNPAVFLRCN